MKARLWMAAALSAACLAGAAAAQARDFGQDRGGPRGHGPGQGQGPGYGHREPPGYGHRAPPGYGAPRHQGYNPAYRGGPPPQYRYVPPPPPRYAPPPVGTTVIRVPGPGSMRAGPCHAAIGSNTTWSMNGAVIPGCRRRPVVTTGCGSVQTMRWWPSPPASSPPSFSIEARRPPGFRGRVHRKGRHGRRGRCAQLRMTELRRRR